MPEPLVHRMKTPDSSPAATTTPTAAHYPAEFYRFEDYVTRHRMLTFWYQIGEILRLRPATVLEIGVGPGLVASYLRHRGIAVTTLDINPSLQPDVVGSVLELESLLRGRSFDLTLCSRVLHHLPFTDFPAALQQIAAVTRDSALLSLPQEDFRFYFLARYTSSQLRTVSLGLPLFGKRILRWLQRTPPPQASSFWKIDSSPATALRKVRACISADWNLVRDYAIPEDSAHRLFVLRKQPPQPHTGRA